MKKAVSFILVIFYLYAACLLKIHVRGDFGDNLLLLFPVGILLPKIGGRLENGLYTIAMGSIIGLALFSFVGGALGTFLGWLGYVICEEKIESKK